MKSLSHDLRFGARLLLRSPGITATAILMPALGIGADVAAFGVVEAVVRRPLPLRETEPPVRIWEHQTERNATGDVINPGNFMGWREQHATFAEMATLVGRGMNLTGDGPGVRTPWPSRDATRTRRR